MVSLLLYVVLFVVIMVIGIGFIFFQRRKNTKAKNAVSIIIFQRTATGIVPKATSGSEIVENTQRMLDVPEINRKFTYPAPTTMIFGTFMYLQTDEITYRQLMIKTDVVPNSKIKALLETINKAKSLSDKEKDDLRGYFQALELKPEIDPAFRHIYANNVEKIVIATTVEDDSIWAKLAKFMPVIMIVATCLGLAILMYAYVPLFNAAIGHVTLTCTNSAAPATNVSALTSTIKPPTI